MNQNSIKKDVILTLVGLIICLSGFILLRKLPEAAMPLRTLPYICIGIGTGIFGQYLGALISSLVLRNHPNSAKVIEIESKDERNIMIRNMAKSKAYDFMIRIFGMLLVILSLIGIDLFVLLAFVAAYLLIVFSNIYYITKYQKEI